MKINKTVGFFTNNKYNPVTGCWNWIGAQDGKGYGVMRYLKRKERVHRISAHLYLGYVFSSPLHVLHRCDNPLCFNPKHLFVGTESDNQRDSVVKKRHAKSKLTRCRRGHSLSGDNLYLYKGRGRTCRCCRQCRREYAAATNLTSTPQ